MLPAILAYFEDLPDPRHRRTRLHPLTSVLGIALCAVLCGADSWVEIEEYGLAKQEWLSCWLDLPHGIPSHDTFARVFARLEPATLGGCLLALLDIAGCIVTIDAMGTQKAVASQIVAQGGDYVLALKGNQESIHTDVGLFFEHALSHRFEGVPHDHVELTDFRVPSG